VYPTPLPLADPNNARCRSLIRRSRSRFSVTICRGGPIKLAVPFQPAYPVGVVLYTPQRSRLLPITDPVPPVEGDRTRSHDRSQPPKLPENTRDFTSPTFDHDFCPTANRVDVLNALALEALPDSARPRRRARSAARCQTTAAGETGRACARAGLPAPPPWQAPDRRGTIGLPSL